MGRKLFTILMVFLLATPVMAQEKNEDEKVVDTTFILISSSLAVSTVFDVETTHMALKRPGTRELNPFMRPFVNAGRPVNYAVQSGLNIGVIYLSYRVKKSKNPKIRRLWWVVPVSWTVGHTIAGGFNLRFVL